MLEMRILSLNSTGEGAIKAAQICDAQYQLCVIYIFLLQGAQQDKNSAISTLIAYPAPDERTIGPNYHGPSDHSSEMLLPATPWAGYICVSKNNLTILSHLQLCSYNADDCFTEWKNNLNSCQRADEDAIVAYSRPPAYKIFSIYTGPDADIFLITWHASMESFMIVPLVKMRSQGLLDSYWILECINLINMAKTQALAKNSVVIVAGDLNINNYGLSIRYFERELSDDFHCFGHNLDHFLAWRPSGGNVEVQGDAVQGHTYSWRHSRNDFGTSQVVICNGER